MTHVELFRFAGVADPMLQVSDAGVAALAESGTLCRLIARDIPNLTDKSTG